MLPVSNISPYTGVIGFVISFPTALATYYQAWKIREENKQARQGLVFSRNCLEFVLDDGRTVNLVPLETLHSLPKPGDVVLLPGNAAAPKGGILPSAYRVGRVEHIYVGVDTARALSGQARLVKAVAHVEAITDGAGWSAETADVLEG